MDIEKFKNALDREHEWPCDYTFKFIVKRQVLSDVLALLPDQTPTIRPSKKDAYVGVTFCARMDASHDVVDVYKRASAIDSLIAL